MSLTRMLRKLLTRPGSRGVSRVTVGLSSVGPPPALMTIQLSARAEGHPAAEYLGVEAPGPLDVVRDDEVSQQDFLWGRELSHLVPPLVE